MAEKCTACGDGVQHDGSPHLHPKLGSLLCERCHVRVTRDFPLDVRSLLNTAQSLLYVTLAVHDCLRASSAAFCRPMATRNSAAGVGSVGTWWVATAA